MPPCLLSHLSRETFLWDDSVNKIVTRVDRKIQFLTSVISRTCGCLAWLISMVQLPHEQVQDQGVLVVPKGCAAPEGGLVSGRIRWSPFDSLVDCCG